MLVGVLLALGASACWALANVAIQQSGRAVGAVRALLWAQIAGGAGIGLLSLVFDRRLAPITPAVLAWGVVAGFAALLAYVCLFAAFAHGRLSITVPIMSSWAVISAGISIGLLGERLRTAQIVGAALVMVGVLLVARSSSAAGAAAAGASPPVASAGVGTASADAGTPVAPTDTLDAARTERLALLASLGAAVGFGVLVPAIDRVSPATGRLGAIGAVYLLDILLGLPIAIALRASLRPPPAAAWPKVAAAGFFETVGFACVSLGAVHAPVAVVSPIASLSAALTVLYAWLVLRERPGRLAAVGAALASAGVVTLSL